MPDIMCPFIFLDEWWDTQVLKSDCHCFNASSASCKLLILSVSQTHHLEYWENRSTGDLRDVGSMPGSGRCPGEGNGNLLQNSYLENSMDRGAWWATVHGVAKSQTWLIMHTHDMTYHDRNAYVNGLFWHLTEILNVKGLE